LKRARKGVRALVAQLGVGDDAAQLVLPNVPMNHSGQVVAPLLQYFDVGLDRLLVIHDDIDLPFAKLRLQFGRGAGGHNGVTSIIGSIGGPGFWRLKLGVGRPPGAMDPAAFVLRRFTARESAGVGVMIEQAADAIEDFVMRGPEVARQHAGDAGQL
jgi:PTH1 family peptidyl-tRNA hydrolase